MFSRREGYRLTTGADIVLCSNIPGGGMSRSASLSLNLIETVLELNGIRQVDGMRVVQLAQMVENDYIGSPCGNLDQIMIYFAKAGLGTLYSPRQNTLTHVPLGASAADFRLVALDTGTDRPGLEKSTYKVRRQECEQLVELARQRFSISCLADVKSKELYERIQAAFVATYPHLGQRLKYIFEAQNRLAKMLTAWRR